MVSHSPSDAATTRPPPSGSSAARISGSATAYGLASRSPSVRDIMSPPGQSRSGHAASFDLPDDDDDDDSGGGVLPPRGHAVAISPPAFFIRSRSVLLLSSRWSNVSVAVPAAVSRKASESPTFASVTTRSCARSRPPPPPPSAASLSSSPSSSAAATTKTVPVAPAEVLGCIAASIRVKVSTSAPGRCRRHAAVARSTPTALPLSVSELPPSPSTAPAKARASSAARKSRSSASRQCRPAACPPCPSKMPKRPKRTALPQSPSDAASLSSPGQTQSG